MKTGEAAKEAVRACLDLLDHGTRQPITNTLLERIVQIAIDHEIEEVDRLNKDMFARYEWRNSELERQRQELAELLKRFIEIESAHDNDHALEALWDTIAIARKVLRTRGIETK